MLDRRFVAMSWLALFVGVMLGMAAGRVLHAHAAPVDGWRQTGLTEPTSAISVATDGALIAH